jgi:hypothetical protein
MTSAGIRRRQADQTGLVGLNLVLVVAFAFFAVTMLTRTTLAARHISEHVKIIVTEVGPGSNVSRLDETAKLDSVGQTAEDILAAVRPLSGQAGEIVSAATSIDDTVSALNVNTGEINTSVRSIDSIASQLVPVVTAIRGDAGPATGVAGINVRVDAALPVVGGISSDLGSVDTAVGGIDGHVASIDCALSNPAAGLLGTAGGLLSSGLDPFGPTARSCGGG